LKARGAQSGTKEPPPEKRETFGARELMSAERRFEEKSCERAGGRSCARAARAASAAARRAAARDSVARRIVERALPSASRGVYDGARAASSAPSCGRAATRLLVVAHLMLRAMLFRWPAGRLSLHCAIAHFVSCLAFTAPSHARGAARTSARSLDHFLLLPKPSLDMASSAAARARRAGATTL
jgi:hypothetical protein